MPLVSRDFQTSTTDILELWKKMKTLEGVFLFLILWTSEDMLHLLTQLEILLNSLCKSLFWFFLITQWLESHNEILFVQHTRNWGKKYRKVIYSRPKILFSRKIQILKFVNLFKSLEIKNLLYQFLNGRKVYSFI